MYRSSAMRLLSAFCRRSSCRFPFQASAVRISVPYIYNSAYSSGTNSESWNSSSSTKEGSGRVTDGPRVKWREEEERVLRASLRHVIGLGWSDAAMIAGAKAVGLSPSIVGSFPRKEAALVEFFMDDCLQKLVDVVDAKEDLKNLIPSQRVAELVRIRLEMQTPYISKWAQALSIQAMPLNIMSSFNQRAMLVDEISQAAFGESTDIDWYMKRAVVGGIYSSAELYMLTDTSPDFKDTWEFLDERVRDVFDLKNSFQEAKYLAEAVGAGVGGSVQGFLRK
ncbi:hypothetical protein M569_00828, partial [Genlisea aurea]